MSSTKKYGLDLRWIRFSLGIIYFWFGALKFFPDRSPAQQIAMDTIERLSFGLVPGYQGLLLLAAWEVVLGIVLILGFRQRLWTGLLFIHLLGTFSPLLLFPVLSFHDFPFGFTLLGQYIMKNLVLVAVVWLLWNEDREGRR
jgi:uncharacterized membrane protein YkgB